MKNSLAAAFLAVYLLVACVIGMMLSGPAHGQTSGSINIDSARAPFSARFTYSLTLQTESLNALGKLAPNPGQVAKVGLVDLLKQAVILAEIPGPKLLATTPAGTKTVVSSVKATWVVRGGIGVRVDNVVVHVDPLNIEVPAGQTLALRYEMPAQGTSLSLAPGTFSWLVGVGVKASAIPAPVAPGPVATGPAPIGSGPSALVTSSIADGATLSGSSVWAATVTPDPTLVQFFVDGTLFAGIAGVPPYSTNLTPLANGPHQLEVKATYPDKSTKSAIINVTAASGIPPLVVLNKPGDAAPPLVELNAPDGKWTFVARKIFRNGVDMTPLGYTDLARIYIGNDGRLCTDGSVHGYLCWNGAASAWGG